MEVNKKLRNFIENNLIVFDEEVNFSDSDNIFQKGFVNSLFAMKLLNFVENEFKIEVENDDMDIKNFSSIDNIMQLINKKQRVIHE
jgi:methoxymalonate biosynthesis acyl carrier protein